MLNQFCYNQGRNLVGATASGSAGVAPYNPMGMTQPHFFNFFESGENMTVERFAKSREQARRNKMKKPFSPTLNRMNTFERGDTAARPNEVPMDEPLLQIAPQQNFAATLRSPF